MRRMCHSPRALVQAVEGLVEAADEVLAVLVLVRDGGRWLHVHLLEVCVEEDVSVWRTWERMVLSEAMDSVGAKTSLQSMPAFCRWPPHTTLCC